MFAITIQDDTILVGFKIFKQELVTAIKDAPSRKYNSNRRLWELPNNWRSRAFIFDTLLPKFANSEGPSATIADSLVALYDQDKQAPLKDTADFPPLGGDFQYVLTPYKHQEIGFNYVINNPYWALFLEMGTGKTKIIIDAYRYKRQKGEVDKLLVVAPNTVMGVWPSEFAKNDLSGISCTILQGTKAKRLKLLQNAGDVIIINYEGLRVIEKEIIAYLKNVQPMLAVDESTRIKNPFAKQSKALLRISKYCVARYILTGTPVTQNYLDLFSQFAILDPDIFGFNTFTGFRNHYAIFGGYQGYELLGFKNKEELKSIVEANSYRVLKKDCLDLPDKVFTEYTVNMGSVQAEIYRSMYDESCVEISELDHASITVVLTKLLRLQQITSGFLPIDQEGKDDHRRDHLFPCAKLEGLKDILKDIVLDQGEKLSIICRFKKEIQIIEDAINELGIKYITVSGAVNQEQRTLDIKAYQEQDDIKVAVLQIQTAKEGITLTACNKVVFYTLDYSLNNFLQVQDRFHRPGQKNKVTYIALITEGTVDRGIYHALSRKFDLAQYILEQGEAGFSKLIKGDIDSVADVKEEIMF